MEAKITLGDMGINYIVQSLNIDTDLNHRNSPYLGAQDGSDLAFVSRDARVITCKSLVTTSEGDNSINDYINLAETYKDKTGLLTINDTSIEKNTGNFMVTGFNIVENTGGDFEISWKFTEQTPFNVTKKTFRVWNKAQALKNAKSKMYSKDLDSQTKKLLKDCNLMVYGYKGTCVKYLQHFLQKNGYYTKYKVTGTFDKNTKEALKKLQKKCKLKTSGEWDLNTLMYFQIKTGYPASVLASNKKGATKILSSNKKSKKKK